MTPQQIIKNLRSELMYLFPTQKIAQNIKRRSLTVFGVNMEDGTLQSKLRNVCEKTEVTIKTKNISRERFFMVIINFDLRN